MRGSKQRAMDIQVDENMLRLGEHILLYDGYYFGVAGYTEVPNSQVLSGMLRQWAAALTHLADGQKPP